MRFPALSNLSRRLLIGGVCVAAVIATTTSGALAGSNSTPAASPPAAAPAAPCTAITCNFSLGINPGLGAGKPFACPAIAQATATISIANRFPRGALNDVMTLTAKKLPPNTGFDLFLVTNSPLDATFSGFGFGWYQSDVQSDSGGNVTVTVRGIFDHETFVLNPGNSVLRTYNVGFWFDSPTAEAAACGSPAPAATPFNGEQNAGLLAMITKNAPLNTIR